MSISLQPINNNEGGLSVRSKLNTMFKELISGTEGVNAIWQKIAHNIGFVPVIGDVQTLPSGSNAVVTNTNKSITKTTN